MTGKEYLLAGKTTDLENIDWKEFEGNEHDSGHRTPSQTVDWGVVAPYARATDGHGSVRLA